jgi:hypothetical protein
VRRGRGVPMNTAFESEDTFSMPSSHVVLDQVDVAFD